MYSTFQKFLSGILIFSILLSFTIRVPFIALFGPSVFAGSGDFYYIVSVIVNQSVYSNVKSEIERYSKDIQGKLENTRVIILPTPDDVTAFQIASLNESLYFDGYKGLEDVDFESKLIGTVLIGELPIPVVYDNGSSSKTIFPYVDFEKKSYIYNNENKRYEKSRDNIDGLEADIWHGVIMPNTGTSAGNISAIKDYFDKNHEFYLGTGNFQKAKGIINGNKSISNPENYEPYVFYYDQFREQASVKYSDYTGYQAYLENLEDITYKRYSKDLAEKIKDKILGMDDEQLVDLITKVDPNFDTSSLIEGPDTANTFDIHSRYITDNTVKNFMEIFNDSTLGEFRKDVFNAGRYNEGGGKVNVDMVPLIVSVFDLVSAEVIRSANNDLENEVDNIVTNGLQRNIAVPVNIELEHTYFYEVESTVTTGIGTGATTEIVTERKSVTCDSSYLNFLHGTKGSSISKASDCSIYRGSTYNNGTLVEANRGLNVGNIQLDINRCNTAATSGYWGGNSPLNLDQNLMTNSIFRLNGSNLKGSIEPLYDIKGSNEITDSSKNPSPLLCEDNNYLLAKEESISGLGDGTISEGDPEPICVFDYQIPTLGPAVGWSCSTTNVGYNFSKSFEQNYKTLPLGSLCDNHGMFLDGVLVKGQQNAGVFPIDLCDEGIFYKYNYKKVPSYIVHKSPLPSEISSQVNYMLTPSLPIDTDRYIDFIGADGAYKKIKYPYLFRINGLSSNSTLAEVDNKLKTTLDSSSTSINNIISSSDPSSLTGDDLEIYNLLKSGNAPSANVNLYNYLKSKSVQSYTLDGDSKELNYYDTLVFSLYWKSLPSVSQKYKYIFDNFLYDEFSNDSNFHLAKNKKIYEISYLGAPGDGNNMYIKLDPEENSEIKPYSSISSSNINLSNSLMAYNLSYNEDSSTTTDDGLFECAPPEGVPIWEWIPAVMCWLSDMLPPKISISNGDCGGDYLFFDDNSNGGNGYGNSSFDENSYYSFNSNNKSNEVNQCGNDYNKNGIDDCVESKLSLGSINISSDSSNYYYNSAGVINAEIFDKDGLLVTYDSGTNIDFELYKIEAPLNKDVPFNESNKKVIYDINDIDEVSTNEVKKYINFNDLSVRSVGGKAKYIFSTKGKDSDIYFRTKVNLDDSNGISSILLQSNILKISVRGDRLFIVSNKISQNEGELQKEFTNSIVASDKNNVYLTDLTNLDSVENLISSNSTSKEKMLLQLSNISNDKTTLNLTYPLEVKFYSGINNSLYKSVSVNNLNSSGFIPLAAIKEAGTYKVEIKDSNNFKVVKNIEILPELQDSLELKLGTNILETGGAVTSNLISVLDIYGNIVSGTYYKLDISISGDGIVFESNGDKDISYNIVEGYKAFKLKTTNTEGINTLGFILKDLNGNVLLSDGIEIETISGIKLNISNIDPNVMVGGDVYDFDINLTDASGNLLSDFDSRAYLSINNSYGSPISSYVNIVGGKASVSFKTKNLAGKDIPLEVKAEGISGMAKTYISILPDKPIKIELALNKNKIEASPSDYSLLNVELKDKFGNLVFTDNTTQISLEIKDEYKDIIKSTTNSLISKGGKAEFKINGTDTPGTAYFKVSTNPSLSNNSFDIVGQSPFKKGKLAGIDSVYISGDLTEKGRQLYEVYDSENFRTRFNSIDNLTNNSVYLSLPSTDRLKIRNLWLETNSYTINGVGEAAGKIETFYFWNKTKSDGKNYNSLYTTLLGSSYGDVTQKDYMGGSLIFARNNRALSVTSLLNNPGTYNDVISINPKGNLNLVYNSRDLSQDINTDVYLTGDNILYVNLFNNSLNTLIGKLYYKFPSDSELKICSDNIINFADCNINETKTSILFSSTDNGYIATYSGDKIVLKSNSGVDLLEITKAGKFIKKSNIDISINKNNKNDFIVFDLKYSGNTIGKLGFNFEGSTTSISRDETIVNNKLSSLVNSLIMYIPSSLYGTRDIYGDSQLKSIYYNDPFDDEFSLDSFSVSDYGYENFHDDRGLGWKSGNKSLLEFASGESVGESTKQYMSFSLINLGDPVISLKKIQEDLPGTNTKRSFDSTIGSVISLDRDIEGYQVLDYNNDNREDIILIKTDNYIKLLENTDSDDNFLDMGNLVNIFDLGSPDLVLSGDFTGDGYDDIFFVNNKGKPFLINNYEKDFQRKSLFEQFLLNGVIIKARSFDMDNDGKDDIITLDDSGKVNIFYGGGNANSPVFTKKTVGSGFGVELDSSSRAFGSAVYYDGIYQLPSNLDFSFMTDENDDLLSEFINNGVVEQDIPDELIDNLIFIQLASNSNSNTDDNELSFDQSVNSIPAASSEPVTSAVNSAISSINNFSNSYNQYINYSNLSSNTSQDKKTYIKGEYSQSVNLKIDKTYVDTNGGFLTSGDIVEASVKIKNTGTSAMRNISFVDSIEDIFFIQENSFSINGISGIEVKSAPTGYDYMIEGFDLFPGQQINISFKLVTYPLDYGHLLVGLFEDEELGDDEWGDIILKDSSKNCSQNGIIYRSEGSRTYSAKGDKEPVCDESKLKLPGDLDKNKVDNDGNGIPDYIDDLVNGSQENFEDYANDALNQLNIDSDGDGIPDQDDITPNYNGDSDNLLGSLDKINEKVDEISEKLDFLMEGFGCGFGGGSCISSPLNWAPLAPGSAPTLFGFPLGPLTPNTGLPVFSSLTWMPTPGGCVPSTWPPSPLGAGCTIPSAGGWLGTWDPTNTVRIFVTPTITGAVGTAVCFGGPAIVAGYINPPGIHPIITGGNCVVAAMPLFGCEDDGSDGDIESTGFPQTMSYNSSSSSNYSIINGNCPVDKSLSSDNIQYFDQSLVDDYIDYKNSGSSKPSLSLSDRIKDAFSKVAEPGIINVPDFSRPLLNIDGNGTSGSEISIDFDLSSVNSGNYPDVIKISKSRVSAFPDFLMDWVTRQIEEFVNKLTDFPTLFIIMPDFSGLMDYGWGDFTKNFEESYEKGKIDRKEIDNSINTQITALNSQKSTLDCSGNDSLKCNSIDLKISKLGQTTNLGLLDSVSGIGNLYDAGRGQMYGIREVYDFLSNIPVISVEPVSVNVNIPWIDKFTLQKAIFDWKQTGEQWLKEIEEFKNNANVGKNFDINSSALLNSLNKNIEVLEGYLDFPDKLAELLNKKEEWLSQILCNVESISTLTGERIGKNGKRFKAWVEFFILIKAILKSWQLIVDVFLDYDAQCHECKNERHDLMYYIWKLISMIIPKIPVIQFPKWPDIILDLHNIRVGIVVQVPDFHLNFRPISLPTLPDLNLPSVGGSLSLPSLPILPEFQIPELPDIPTLPKIELPNLPPPPTLPKMFASLEAVLDILKLVTKLMCILKSSPFVPEWRAGDQIAFITERQGFLPMDFIDLSLPQFSLPFIDAIEVTTYVNFEFDVDFIVEMARQVVSPLNSYSNDIVNKFKVDLSDLEVLDKIPGDVNIDVDVNQDGSVDTNVGYNNKMKGLSLLALLLGKNIIDLSNYVEENKNVTVENKEFLSLVNNSLSSEKMTRDPKLDKLYSLWDHVNSYTYSKEDKIISDLLENNKEKFDDIKNIINTEIINSKKQKDEFEFFSNPNFVLPISSNTDSRFDSYNSSLEKYNLKTFSSILNLKNGNNYEKEELEIMGDELKAKINEPIKGFSDLLEKEKENSIPVLNNNIALNNNIVLNNNLLALNNQAVATGNSCQESNNSDYKYVYEGIYVVEGGKSYNLFSYSDELTGDEETTIIDYDGDGDDDLLYLTSGELFLKTNLTDKPSKEYFTGNPITLNFNSNKFFNGDTFYESVNYFEESYIGNGFINVGFLGSTNLGVNNYRLEAYRLVDKFNNLDNSGYTPQNLRKIVVDSFSDIDSTTIYDELGTDNDFTLRNNLGYINYVGNVPGVVLKTKGFKNIKDDISSGKAINLSAGTVLYSGNNSFSIRYFDGNITNESEEKTFLLQKNMNVEFNESIKIVGIDGDAYVESNETISLIGETIRNFVGLPLLPGAELNVIGDFYSVYNESSHIDISYYDTSSVGLNFTEIESYNLYDLGIKSNNYLISLPIINDYFYTKIRSFKNDVFSTNSNQVLLSPQIESDTYAPLISVNGGINIPVYQSVDVDFTDYIYEDSGIGSIDKIYIDFDLDTDTSGDGNKQNDNDGFDVSIGEDKITIKFGRYNSLIKKNIGITVVDNNGNKGFASVPFEVYSPNPRIDNLSGNIVEGDINEGLVGEPINIYRYRFGNLSSLENTDGEEKTYTIDGSYNFIVPNGQDGLSLTKSGTVIANINEDTGLISLTDTLSSSISVEGYYDYPRIVVNHNGEEIYYQELRVFDQDEVKIVDDFSEDLDSGIYIKFLDKSNYNFYKIPKTVSYNSGLIGIYKISDLDKEFIFKVFKDGRIKLANELSYIEYGNYNNYVILKLYDESTDKYVAEVLYKMDGSYIIN